MQNVLQSLRQSLVQAGNTALAPSDRQAIAASLQSDYQQLLGLANSRGADGNYLFGGFSQTNQPFVATATGARYEGDQGTKVVQVGAGRSIQGSINGADLFLRVRDGNGTFATAQSSTNTGTGVIDGGSVSNAAQWTSDTYSISFSQSGTATQYTVTDQTLGTTVAGPSDFSAGAAIAFDGISVGITGTPAAGDTFSVTPSRNSDVFSQIKSAIALVSGSVSGGSAGANYSAGIASQLQFIDQATSQLLSQRAVVGANLQALSTLKTMTGTQSTQLQTQMSSLRDVDYASAVSQFAAAQTAYQAAQASYAKVAQMTLFDKI
jgi:flagellar hook-associated protein 3 FlgL